METATLLLARDGSTVLVKFIISFVTDKLPVLADCPPVRRSVSLSGVWRSDLPAEHVKKQSVLQADWPVPESNWEILDDRVAY